MPLEGLFLRLEAAGFEITPADRLRVYRLLRAFGPDRLKNPEELGMIIGPALCRNGGEQAVFSRIYATYLEELRATKPALGRPAEAADLGTETRVKRWFDRSWPYIMLISFVVALGGFFLVRDYLRESGKTSVAIIGPDVARIDESIVFENASYFSGKDSTELQWVWTITSGSTGDTILVDSTNWDLPYRVAPILDDQAQQLVALEISAPGNQNNGRAIKSLDVRCSNPPPLIGIKLPEDLANNSPYTEYRFTALFDEELLESEGRKPDDYEYSWRVDGENQGRSRTLVTALPVEKRYEIQVTVSSGRASAPCQVKHATDVVTGVAKVTVPTYAFQPVEHERNAGIKKWVPWTLGGIWIALFIWGFRRWNKEVRALKQAAREEAEMRKRAEDKVLAIAPDKPPYKIPWVSQAKNIPLEASHLRLARAMRQRASEEGARVLNVPATLKATINSGGYPNARFSAKSFASEYVLLIDEVDPKSHRGRLFRRLATELTRRDVYAEVFYYQHQLNRCWNEREPEGISTDELVQRFGGQRLLILGDGHELLDHAAKGVPSIAPRYLQWISAFPQRLILTPIAPVDWGFQEKLLSRYFGLFPSDGAGILLAAEKLENSQLSIGGNFDGYRDKMREKRRDLSTKDFRWRNGDDVLDYFDHDLGLQIWAMALAVYPNPNLDLTVAIGRALSSKGVEVNYDNLLKISRWPAMDEGYISSGVREDLLEDIPPEIEKMARAAVAEELSRARPAAAGGYAEQQLDNILIVQRYLLDKDDDQLKKELHYLINADVLDDALLDDLEREIEREHSAPSQDTNATAPRQISAEEARKAVHNATKESRNLLSRGETQKAIIGLHPTIARFLSQFEDESWLLRFKIALLRNEADRELFDEKEFSVQKTKINSAALDWLSKLEKVRTERYSLPSNTPQEGPFIRIKEILGDGQLIPALESARSLGDELPAETLELIKYLQIQAKDTEKDRSAGRTNEQVFEQQNALAFSLLSFLREVPLAESPEDSPEVPSEVVESFVKQKQYTQALGYLAEFIEKYAPKYADELDVLRNQSQSIFRKKSPPPLTKQAKTRPTSQSAAPGFGERTLENGLMALAKKLDAHAPDGAAKNIPPPATKMAPPSLEEYFQPDRELTEEGVGEEELSVDLPRWFPMMIGVSFWIVLFALFGLYRWHNSQGLHAAMESYGIVALIAEDKGPTSDYARAHVQAITAYANGDYATFLQRIKEAQEYYPEDRYPLAETNHMIGVYNEGGRFFNDEQLPVGDTLRGDDNFWALLSSWFEEQLQELGSDGLRKNAMSLNLQQLRGLMEYYAIKGSDGALSAKNRLFSTYSGELWDQYFDTLSYRPNLATLLDRESTRVVDLAAVELSDGGLRVTTSYYLRPSLLQRTGVLEVKTESGRSEQFSVNIDPDVTSASIDLEAEDFAGTSDSLTVIIQEYDKDTWEEVALKTVAFRHVWAPTQRTPDQPVTPSLSEEQNQRVRLVNRTTQAPLGGTSVVVYPVRRGESVPTVGRNLAVFLRNRRNPLPVVSLISNREGYIELDPPAEDVSSYLLSITGFTFQIVSVEALSEAPTTVRFQPNMAPSEEPSGSEFTIQIVNDSDDQPITGARLIIERGESQEVVNTDAITGLHTFSIPDGNESDIIVTTSVPGFRDETVNLSDPIPTQTQVQQSAPLDGNYLTVRLQPDESRSSFVLRAGERRRLTKAASPLQVDRFVVEGDAVLELADDVEDFVIEAVVVDIEGVLTITNEMTAPPGRGANGAKGLSAGIECAKGNDGQMGGPGPNGSSGPSVSLSFENILRLEGIDVLLRGQNGGPGGNGGNGGRGGPGSCARLCPSGRGGNGGSGGRGGNGGSGGSLTIENLRFAPKYGGQTTVDQLIKFSAPPGLRGPGGRGGQGGAGGQGAPARTFPPCPANLQRAGQDGKNGSAGSPGYNGAPGQLINRSN